MKMFFLAMMVVCVVTTAPGLYAQEQTAGRMDEPMMMDKHGPKMDSKMDMKESHDMMKQGMMMHMMMMKEIVPTSDGGVVVLMCGKLFKYDKNLELKKETELKIDWDRMQKMMMEMKQRMSQMSQE